MGREIRVDARGPRVRERAAAATGGGRAWASRDAARASPARAPAAGPLIRPSALIPIRAPPGCSAHPRRPHSRPPRAPSEPPPEGLPLPGVLFTFRGRPLPAALPPAPCGAALVLRSASAARPVPLRAPGRPPSPPGPPHPNARLRAQPQGPAPPPPLSGFEAEMGRRGAGEGRGGGGGQWSGKQDK